MKKITVQRYLPETSVEPFKQTFEVSLPTSASVLDALLHIKEQIDPTLSFRWSCRMALCGSCGFMINGVPKLGCKAFVRDYEGEIRIEPLAHFPIEKDLVVNMEVFLQHLEAVQPYLIRAQEETLGQVKTFKQTPQERSKIDKFSQCINCALCYSACPQFGLNPKFLGPAAITLTQRYHLDNRDQGEAQRMPLLNTKNGPWACTFVGYCSDVCPQQIDPAAAVNQAKVRSAKNSLIQLFKGSL